MSRWNATFCCRKLEKGIGGKKVSHVFTLHFHLPTGVDKMKKPQSSIEQNKLTKTSNKSGESPLGTDKRWLSLMECLITPTSKTFHTQPGFVGQNAVEEKGIFDLNFNFTVNRVVITMAEDYNLDLTEGEFASFIGYEKTLGFERCNEFHGKNTSWHNK